MFLLTPSNVVDLRTHEKKKFKTNNKPIQYEQSPFTKILSSPFTSLFVQHSKRELLNALLVHPLCKIFVTLHQYTVVMRFHHTIVIQVFMEANNAARLPCHLFVALKFMALNVVPCMLFKKLNYLNIDSILNNRTGCASGSTNIQTWNCSACPSGFACVDNSCGSGTLVCGPTDCGIKFNDAGW